MSKPTATTTPTTTRAGAPIEAAPVAAPAPGLSPAPPAGMPDVQATQDVRRVAIDKVGVKDVTYPMRLALPGGGSTRPSPPSICMCRSPTTRRGRT